jgi:aspartyl-tRNA(Asn)/glutamyl-tRNA(Gln) amidotransferase subunit B
MDYEAIIGMEVHVHLLTRSKMFCGCDADVFGAPPNTHVCPVCTGMPGSLPVINRRAVEFTIMTGLALHCQVAESTLWERKSYFYPDLPKGYQISQYQLPLTYGGWLEIEVDGQDRRINIRRAHLEEDTGKLFHVNGVSLIDYNRCGVPLLEIVTEPDLRSADEAYAYLTKLRTILRYLGVSSGDMEKGAMRCEANISLRPIGSSQFGTKTEIKNLNSFRAVKLALDYEIKRQARLLDAGEKIRQETMGWDDVRGVTVVQRSKEEAHDYRYFPEPDLPPLVVSREWVEEIRATLPELPDARRNRFMADYGLSRYDAGVLVGDKAVAEYYEACVAAAERREGGGRRVSPKSIANWVTGELFRFMRSAELDIDAVKITPAHLVDLIALVEGGTITGSAGKEVFSVVFETGRSPGEIVEERGMKQISDADQLSGIVDQVIATNPDPVAQYLGGKDTAIRFLIGQVMRATRGQANPGLAEELLRHKLSQQ